MDGMKVTIEGLKQGVEGVGGALSEIKNVTARTADTLTAFYCMLKDSQQSLCVTLETTELTLVLSCAGLPQPERDIR